MADIKRQAAREIKYFANTLKGFMAVAEELEELADLEKAIAETKAELAPRATRAARRTSWASISARCARN